MKNSFTSNYRLKWIKIIFVRLPRISSNVSPHREQDGCGDEAVLDDEGEEIGSRVLDDVAHDEVPAAGEVVREVDHTLTVRVWIHSFRDSSQKRFTFKVLNFLKYFTFETSSF